MPKTNYHDTDDREILQLYYADNDNYLLGILLQRYTMLLFGVCMKYLKNDDDARDAVQQVFLKAINELQKYKVDYFKSWLYMIAKNHCLMQLRNKDRHPAALSETMLHTPDERAHAREAVAKDLVLTHMEAALQQLSSEQKLCVTLFYLEKKTYHQIADCTGFSLMQVKSNIQNGKRNLKLQMQRMQGDEQ